MEDKNLEKPIPEGWELKDEGSKTSVIKHLIPRLSFMSTDFIRF